MGSSGSKANSSCNSSLTSASSGSFRKNRSKGHRGFQSYCLGTTSGSHDSDNDEQVTHSVIMKKFLIFCSISFFHFRLSFLILSLDSGRYLYALFGMSWFVCALVQEMRFSSSFLSFSLSRFPFLPFTSLF